MKDLVLLLIRLKEQYLRANGRKPDSYEVANMLVEHNIDPVQASEILRRVDPELSSVLLRRALVDLRIQQTQGSQPKKLLDILKKDTPGGEPGKLSGLRTPTGNPYMSMGKPATIKLRIIPEHLKPFWKLYNNLKEKGWFDQVKELFYTNPNNMPPIMRDYGLKLIDLTLTEKNTAKKHEYFTALLKLTEYLGGTLGKDE